MSDVNDKNDKINHTKTRTSYVKQENNWKYINVSLIREWKIKRINNLVDVVININGVSFKCSSKTDNAFVFDFPKLREKWFNSMGDDKRECDLLALEEACMYNQLAALNHFLQVPKEMIKGSLFTDQLDIFILPVWKPRTNAKEQANKLEMEEVYYISDIHKDTYGNE